MTIRTLRITDFRNLEQLDLSGCPGLTLLYGDNGSGKSNILEALFCLCLGRSQRGAADASLVRDGQEVYRLEGEIDIDGRVSEVTVAYQLGGRRRITIDHAPVRPAELFARFCAVALGPEDTEIVAGAPSVRRLFLDTYLAQCYSRYIADLATYQRALAQKNAALRDSLDDSPFTPLLVESGSRVMLERSRFIRALTAPAEQQYQNVSGREGMDLRYAPSVGMVEAPDVVEAWAEQFEHKLEEYAPRERRVGIALVGPHRDDLEMSLGGYPARTHGSQGQWRLAVIALKLGVYEEVARARRTAPVLLMDELFAELDAKRAGALIESLAGFEQLFLTSALPPSAGLPAVARRWRIAEGRVSEVSA